MTRYMLASVAISLAMPLAPAWAQDEGRTLTLMDSEEYGQHLTDRDGRAVYLFTADKASGEGEASISCTDEECTTAWPLFTTSGEPRAGGDLDESLLGTIDHDGESVVTYNGWPLYYFSRDAMAESSGIAGQGVESFGGEWYLVNAEGEPIEDMEE